jgi:predicted Zn-dependent peptidase
MVTSQGEPQKIAVRLYVPGGRMLESKDAPGALVLGTKTMQEGGAFSKMTREEVELFCIDHMVSVEILAQDDALIFDFESVVLPNADIAPGHVSGFEAVMQVLHVILTDFKFEDDAFERAKQGCFENYDMTTKGLETACQQRIIQSLSGNDLRLLVPDHKTIENLDLPTVKRAVLDQLGSESVEVSISGDVPLQEMEDMALNYLGTVPRRPEEKHRTLSSPSLTCKVAGGKKPLVVYFQDSEERAMGYLAGPCANNWGILSNGQSLSSVISARAGNNKEDKRRNHPLFGHAVLQVLQEIANRRLFSVVREERQLTYDASFKLHEFDSVQGGWYTVSVTSSPSQVKAAVEACKDALTSIKGPFGVGGDSLQSVKRTLMNRFRGESLTNKFWVQILSGSQIESIPLKSICYVIEYEKVLNGISLEDVRLLIDELNFCDENYVACIGITSSKPVII